MAPGIKLEKACKKAASIASQLKRSDDFLAARTDPKREARFRVNFWDRDKWPRQQCSSYFLFEFLCGLPVFRGALEVFWCQCLVVALRSIMFHHQDCQLNIVLGSKLSPGAEV